jgi:hypothetical protein
MKQDKILTLKGKILAGDVERISLFDGSFETAYRLLSIVVCPENILASELVSLKLMTEEATHNTDWFWAKNTEVGWAAWNVPINSRFGQFSRVDKEALIVEDLFMDASGDTGEFVNYMIEMEKVNITSWKGALAMVRNKSQGAN